ncbi:hypothetical protein BJY00DRAFT_196361 [Aspergillus carlsbadensis]|nr:hypothetical protein BJY00DRAFT_196361 [Aspergillus carlsbadensis]
MEANKNPTSIRDLPLDILHTIFSYFRDPRIQARGLIEFDIARGWEEEDRRVLLNARLACRLLRVVASPFVFAIIGVELSRSSLDQLVRFSKSDSGQHVRGIRARLQYRPQELAADLDTFSSYRKEVLRNLHGECYRCDGESEYSEDETGEPEPGSRCDLYSKIGGWWDECASGSSGEDVAEAAIDDDPERVKYQALLRQSFKEFRSRHEEQRQLITSREFVTTVASCVARMPNVVALAFEDAKSRWRDWGAWEKMKDMSYLAEVLQEALSWESIEDHQYFAHDDYVRELDHAEYLQQIGDAEAEETFSAINSRVRPPADPHLVPARLLTELPIAMHAAGVNLRNIYIGAFPTRGDFSKLCPDNGDMEKAAAIWSDLQAAYGQLRSINLGAEHNWRHIRHEHPQASQKFHFDEYLGALLCGSRLESVHVRLSAFGLNHTRGNPIGRYSVDCQHRLGDVIRLVSLPQVRKLWLSGISATGYDLESFCAGVGGGVEDISMYAIHLTEGSWMRVLDILRERVQGSRHETRPRVMLTSLAGGEYERLRERLGSRTSSRLASALREFYNGAMDELVTKYVSGAEVMENPFMMPSNIIKTVWRSGLRDELLRRHI